MVQRDQVPEDVNDIERYEQDLFTLIEALNSSSNLDVELDEPISVDDDGVSLTVDTDNTELDLVVQDLIDALEGAAYTDNLTQGGEHLKTRNYGVQPDGDLVGEKAGGKVFSDTVSLNVGEEYVSDWYDTDGFGAIEIFIDANAPSATGGVKIDYTNDVQADPPDVLSTKTREYSDIDVKNGSEMYNFGAELDGFRFRYENNGASVSDVDIVGTLRTSTALDSANYVDSNNVGDTFVRIGTSEAQKGLDIGSPTSLFDDLKTIERRSIVDRTSSFGTSDLRDEILTSGSGSVTQDPAPNGEIEISTGTTADSHITLRSAEYGRYTPGYSAEVGMGIRIPNTPTEGELTWGYFDEDNGFYWGYDGDREELFIARRAQGVERTRVYKSDFNGIPFRDTFGVNFDPSNGYIYQIEFAWYGYGIINFKLVGQANNPLLDQAERQTGVILHSIVVDNDTSIVDPNQPINIRADNGANGEDVSIRIGGRQFSVNGERSSEGRTSSETKESQNIDDGVWTHVMTWRRRDDAGDKNAKLDVDGFDFGADTTIRMAIVINANVSGTTYVTPELTQPSETLVEVSTVGTFEGIDGGSKVWEGSLEVGGTEESEDSALGTFSPKVDVAFGQTKTVSLLVKGVGNGTGISTMRVNEDW